MIFKSTSTKVLTTVGIVVAVGALFSFNSNSGLCKADSYKLLIPLMIKMHLLSKGFVTKNNRNYLTKEEYNARFKIFSDNLGIIRNHDAEA